jgi:hypothetical protein
MSSLNVDVLSLIFEELQYEKKILYSCLLVNRTWCKIIIPILWKNPWNSRKFTRKGSYGIIISLLSNETREILRNQDIYVPTSRRPLFNYVSYCKFLDLDCLVYGMIYHHNSRSDAIPFLINEILELFINENDKLTHLYLMSSSYDYQIPLIPGADHCFSKLEFLRCCNEYNQDMLEWLSKISKSIKILIFNVYDNQNISGIIKFIEVQKNLNKIIWCNNETHNNNDFVSKLLAAIFSKQNLISLVIDFYTGYRIIDWDYLKNLSLPVLKFLTVNYMTSKDLISLINKTKGCLTEINLKNIDIDRDRHTPHVRSIYQNCPNLRYLKLTLFNELFDGEISDFETLLTNCKYLEGLIVDMCRLTLSFDMNNFYKILAKSSPTSLFKFKFSLGYFRRELESLELFFDNWKGRNPMLLQADAYTTEINDLLTLIYKYIGKGIIKSFNRKYYPNFGDFEW